MIADSYRMPAPPFTNCMILSKLLKLCVTIFLHLKNRGGVKHQPIDRVNKIILVLYRTVHWKPSINASHFAINSIPPLDPRKIKLWCVATFQWAYFDTLLIFFVLFSLYRYHPSHKGTNIIVFWQVYLPVFWQVYLPLDFSLSKTSWVLRSYQHALEYHFNQYLLLPNISN